MSDRYSTLPTNLFMVTVPTISTYSEEEIELFGLPLDVIDNNIKDSSHNLSRVMINMSRMIDIYLEGYPITLVNREDIPKIYKILDDYLDDRIEESSFSLNRRTVVDDRLSEIDRFASEVFGYHKRTIVKDNLSVNTGFDLGMTTLGVRGIEHNVETKFTTDNVNTTSVMSGYGDIDDTMTGKTYITNNQPVINLSKIKRRSSVPGRRGISPDDIKD